MSTKNVVYLNENRRAPEETMRSKKILHAVQKYTVQRVRTLLQSVLDKVDDALFELADKAESDTLQNAYFDAMRQVRIKRKSIEAAYVNELNQSFERLDHLIPRKKRESVEDRPEDEFNDSFEIVGDEDLEERLAIESMVNKARATHKNGLGLLSKRLAELVGCVVDGEDHPLDPEFLAESFSRCVTSLDMEIKTRLVIYKLFDKFVISHLGDVYAELNKHLLQAGVLPDLPVGGKAQRTSKSTPSSSTSNVDRSQGQGRATEHSLGGGTHGATKVTEDELFSALHEILAQRKGDVDDSSPTYGEWTGNGYRPAASTVESADVLKALSVIQHQQMLQPSASAGEAGEIKLALRNQIKRFSGESEAIGIGRREDDTIDIIAMLFDFVLDDPNLSNSVKALVARLQIPVLKVAILDKSFFSQKKHPARNLINELAQAGLGVSTEDDPVYLKIQEIVSRILNDFEDDPGLFERVLNDLRQFVVAQVEKARVIEERTKQAAEGKAKVDGARDFVKRCLDERKARSKLPQVVISLMDDAWSKVLFISLLRSGSDSEEYKQSLAVIDRLVWSLSPKQSLDERKQLLHAIPAILHDLREGLSSILYNSAETTKLFKALESEHINTIMATDANIKARMPSKSVEEKPLQADESTEHKLAVNEVAEPIIETVVPDEVSSAVDVSEELQQYVEQLRSAEIGTWFEFIEDNEGTRAKLSAKLNNETRFIFVNRSGFKMADKHIEELAKAMAEKQLTVLDDSLLFDKALESVIGNLRSMKAART